MYICLWVLFVLEARRSSTTDAPYRAPAKRLVPVGSFGDLVRPFIGKGRRTQGGVVTVLQQHVVMLHRIIAGEFFG
jgi:hypothetical protein